MNGVTSGSRSSERLSVDTLLELVGRHGACRGATTDFFSTHELEVARAKTLCSTCPVRLECLEYAQRAPERFGVWGGTDEGERTIKLKPTCSCGGVLLPLNEQQEQCVSCGALWFARS